MEVSLIDAALAIFSFITYLWGKRDGRLARYRDRDRNLYNTISNLLPKTSMAYYRDHDFGDSFTEQVFDRLRQFKTECEYPQNYFLDSELENLRKKLLASSNTFRQRLSEATVHVSNPNTPAYRLPHPEVISMEAHRELDNELNNLATKFYEDYVEFVIAAEKILA